MLLVGSMNANVGFADGMKILRDGEHALDARGNHAAFTTEIDREVTYVFQTDAMENFETRERIAIPLSAEK